MRSRARRLFILAVSLSAIGQMIGACGQKGDLYLPQPQQGDPKEKANDSPTVGARRPGADTGPKAKEETASETLQPTQDAGPGS